MPPAIRWMRVSSLPSSTKALTAEHGAGLLECTFNLKPGPSEVQGRTPEPFDH